MSVSQPIVTLQDGRRNHIGPSLPALKADKLRTAKAYVERAVKKKKVFSIQGPYPVIRTALRLRGWVERRLVGASPLQKLPRCPFIDGGEDKGKVDEREKVENLDDMYELMVGLCLNLRNLHWFDEADPDSFFPRCYKLGAGDERQAFIEDFRRTACTSILQHVVQTHRRKSAEANESKDTKHRLISSDVIITSLAVCNEFLGVLRHCDIDTTTRPSWCVEEQRWEGFLLDYYMVVHKQAVIRGSAKFVKRCKTTLTKLQEVCPQLHISGINNIWIIKPGAKSRGRGIKCLNRLDEILSLVDIDKPLMKESKWVVQKYLECPLLIYGTKFDVRQWFLVTDWNPLTVWFYKECYLRFSTQPYTTKTLHSSVHLCNNSIQKHFQTSQDRHPGVPDDNMWSSSQFQTFLQQQGRGEAWQSVIVPGMQKAVVSALQTAQDLVEPRKASFELYGADFVLGDDMRPWLLEINASPTMASSSAVTTKLCHAVQVDTLRVVLDRRNDPIAPTGNFQLIYKQAVVEVPHYVGVHLLVEGETIEVSRPVLRKQVLPSNRTLPHQLSQCRSPPCRTKRSHLAAGSHSTGKENKESKKGLASTSQKDEYQKKEGAKSLCISSSGRSFSPKLPLLLRKPRGKSCRFGLSLSMSGRTIKPRSLSFTLSSAYKTPQDEMSHKRLIQRAFSPETFEPIHKVLNQSCPSFYRSQPLPSIEVHHTRPNRPAQPTVPHNSTFSSQSKQEILISSQRLNPRGVKTGVNGVNGVKTGEDNEDRV